MSLAVDNDVFTKGEFARRRNVTPGRLSQWLSEGKISGEAIVGEGRNARIRESVALLQLRKTLEPMQMTGNGLSTKLDAPAPSSKADEPAPAPSSPPASPSTLPPADDSVEDKIKAARLEQIERQNREGRRAEALAAGKLTDAEEAAAQAARATARLVAMFEGKLSDFATAISAAFKLPQRDVLHLLRTEFHRVRGQAAAELRDQAQGLPQLVETELADDQEQDHAES